MSLQKKNRSTVLERAETRAAAISTIADPLDLNGELTLAAFRTAITDARTKQTRYNSLLTEADSARREFQVAEKALADLAERMLEGVSAKYGKDSPSYAMAGGTLKSERKTRVAKQAAQATEVTRAAA
ncbi:MAG: hypothetical protein WC661_17005 [Opitutaceae bacterium]|jgi:hypothetical protein